VPVIDVSSERGTYAIVIEPGAIDRLGALVRDAVGNDLDPSARRAGSAFLAADAAIAATHGAAARRALESAGWTVHAVQIAAEEKEKTLDTVRSLYAAMLEARMERSSPVVALGGGVVGDVAGFAAATYLRGVPLVHVPTTLLAMVDAAIGGKTAVNFPLPRAAGGDGPVSGKNLIGAFWPPRLVVADPRVLGTLPPRELRCGLAECVKHAIIADAGLLALIESRAAAILGGDEGAQTELIARSAAVKVAIVQRDERESGPRALLNLGHTFAHVIEPIPELGLHHGEAVAIGLCAAATAAAATGRLGRADAEAIPRILARLGLPTALARPASAAALMRAMAYDKKVEGGRLRLILPRAIGAAEIAGDVPRGVVEAAWRAVGAGA
jgi:3-dehydroquinate synthase